MKKVFKKENSDFKPWIIKKLKKEKYVEDIHIIETRFSKGVFDLEVVDIDGELFKIELKMPNGKLSRLQEKYFYTIWRAAIIQYKGINDKNHMFDVKYRKRGYAGYFKANDVDEHQLINLLINLIIREY